MKDKEGNIGTQRFLLLQNDFDCLFPIRFQTHDLILKVEYACRKDVRKVSHKIKTLFLL